MIHVFATQEIDGGQNRDRGNQQEDEIQKNVVVVDDPEVRVPLTAIGGHRHERQHSHDGAGKGQPTQAVLLRLTDKRFRDHDNDAENRQDDSRQDRGDIDAREIHFTCLAYSTRPVWV